MDWEFLYECFFAISLLEYRGDPSLSMLKWRGYLDGIIKEKEMYQMKVSSDCKEPDFRESIFQPNS